jgi:8-oxo-dGTP diphosphatase
MDTVPLQIAVAVVIDEGRVLVGQRDSRAENAAGFHEFPGGKVEPGESPAAAAARETLEEAGIAIRVGAILDTVTGSARSGPIEILFFDAAPLDPTAPLRPPFAWVAIAGLANLSFPPANEQVIRRVIAGHPARYYFH